MRRPIDTSVEARELQLAAYRAMTPEHRLRLADEMSTDVRSLTRAGIRARAVGDPGPVDVEAELARILLGPELAFGPELAAASRARQPTGRR